MKRIVALFAVIAAALTFGGRVEATHDNDCEGGFIDLRSNPDRYAVECTGSGKGWAQVTYFCYYVTWVVEDGVVVDTIKHYANYNGPAVFKPWYDPSVWLRVSCPSSRPWLATRPALAPSVIYWHGS